MLRDYSAVIARSAVGDEATHAVQCSRLSFQEQTLLSVHEIASHALSAAQRRGRAWRQRSQHMRCSAPVTRAEQLRRFQMEGRALKNIPNNPGRRLPAQFGFRLDDETMGQRVGRQILDVVRDHVIATANGG